MVQNLAREVRWLWERFHLLVVVSVLLAYSSCFSSVFNLKGAYLLSHHADVKLSGRHLPFEMDVDCAHDRVAGVVVWPIHLHEHIAAGELLLFNLYWG